MSGFITMQREAFDHPLLKDGERFRAWFWLVASACWKQTQFDINGKTVTLQRGQIAVSRSQLAKAWSMSESAVERFLTRLQTEQMIERATGQGRSIITICNYAKYQDVDNKTGQATGQATGQRPDSDRTAKEQGNKGTSKPKSSEDTVVSSGGEPPMIDVVKIIFDAGRSLLSAAGYDEKQARSIIGRWRKSHGDPAVLIAMNRAQIAKPEEPVQWITAALRSEAYRAGVNEHGSEQGSWSFAAQHRDRRDGWDKACDRVGGFDQPGQPARPARQPDVGDGAGDFFLPGAD